MSKATTPNVADILTELKAESRVQQCPLMALPQPLRHAVYLAAQDQSVAIKSLIRSVYKRGYRISDARLSKIRNGQPCDGCQCEA